MASFGAKIERSEKREKIVEINIEILPVLARKFTDLKRERKVAEVNIELWPVWARKFKDLKRKREET